MLPARVLSFCTAIVLISLPSGCVDAAPAAGLAARAVAEAKSMPAGRERDVTLLGISRNLRHADRDHAIEAAAAMSEDYELQTFSPGTHQVLAQQGEWNSDVRTCERFIERLKQGSANAADERRIRDCFSMDEPPGIVPPAIPPFRVILMAADALPPVSSKAQLLYMATWNNVPDRPAGGAVDAIHRLHALLPLLDGGTRRDAAGWLETTSVDLIEGRPDDAIARVRQGFARKPSEDSSLADEPAIQAQGLINDFLHARDFNRAIKVTNLLPPSSDCAMVSDGLTGVTEFVLPMQDSAIVATYLSRLQASGSLARLCPMGLGDEIAVDVWLKAGDDAKALDAATRSGKSLILARTRLAIIERRMGSGDISGARSMLRVTVAARPPLDAGNKFERAAAARQQISLIHFLARMGDVDGAEQLASSYSGPGWRGLAYSVIVATTNPKSGDPDWTDLFLDLPEVPAEH